MQMFVDALAIANEELIGVKRQVLQNQIAQPISGVRASLSQNQMSSA
jgi:hypothetical protein